LKLSCGAFVLGTKSTVSAGNSRLDSAVVPYTFHVVRSLTRSWCSL
jgi:hypothetical protein